LGRKYKVYEEAGVREYWLVHPDRKSIEVYENREDNFRLVQAVRETGIVKSELLKSFEIDLEKIF